MQAAQVQIQWRDLFLWSALGVIWFGTWLFYPRDTKLEINATVITALAALAVSATSLTITIRDRNKDMRSEYYKRRMDALTGALKHMHAQLFISNSLFDVKEGNPERSVTDLEAYAALAELRKGESGVTAALHLYGSAEEVAILKHCTSIFDDTLRMIRRWEKQASTPEDVYGALVSMGGDIGRFTNIIRQAGGHERLSEETMALVSKRSAPRHGR